MAVCNNSTPFEAALAALPLDDYKRAWVIGQLVATITPPDPKYWFETAVSIGMDPAPLVGGMEFQRRVSDRGLYGFLTGWLSKSGVRNTPVFDYVRKVGQVSHA